MGSKLNDDAAVFLSGIRAALSAHVRINHNIRLGILTAFFVLLLPGTASASPLQKTTCVISGAPVACTLPNPVQGGDLLVFEFWSQVAPTSIADTLGSQWKTAAGPLNDIYCYFLFVGHWQERDRRR